jgi:hypothetical protein
MRRWDVATVLAGPCGQSIVAPSREGGIAVRINANPIHPWMTHVLRDLWQKSEGLVSSLFDLDSAFILNHSFGSGAHLSQFEWRELWVRISRIQRHPKAGQLGSSPSWEVSGNTIPIL